jgi:hypothetical protein
MVGIFIVLDLKRHVLKSLLSSYQLEYVVVTSSSPQVKVLPRTVDRFEPTHLDVKLRLAIQVTDTNGYVRDSLDPNCVASFVQ